MNEHLAAVIKEAPSPYQPDLQRLLTQVDQALVKSWLASGAIHEWIMQGSRLIGSQHGATEAHLALFFAATPTMLAVLSPGEIGEWIRAGLDIASADAQAFSVLPEELAELNGAERLNFYRLVRSAAYRSPQAAAALYRSLPRNVQVLSPALRAQLFRCLQAAATFDPEPLPAVLPF